MKTFIYHASAETTDGNGNAHWKGSAFAGDDGRRAKVAETTLPLSRVGDDDDEVRMK